MSFERGSVSMRVFLVPSHDPFPADIAERLAKDAVPSLDAIPAEGCLGWATGRHLLDRNITADTVNVGGMLRVTLVKSEKKIPSALFKAECRQEEIAVAQAKGVPFLKRAEKQEIAKAIKDRLLPGMPPTLSGIDVVRTDDAVYATATSDSACDSLTVSWCKATGQRIMPYGPSYAAMKLAHLDVRTLNSTSFSSEVKDADVEQDLGTEFLTWMWYFSESSGGQHDGFAFMLDGPFTLVHEGKGAHEIVIRKGNPGLAQEAKSALMAGKKLRKAKMVIARGEDTWSCLVDGQEWTFGSLKLPNVEGVDPTSAFQERMIRMATFVEAIESLFKKFIAIRNDPQAWANEVEALRQWVSDRASKA